MSTGIIITGIGMSQPNILITNVSSCLSELGVKEFQIYIHHHVKQNLVTWMVCYRKSGKNVERLSVALPEVLPKYQILKIKPHSFYSDQESRGFYKQFWRDSQPERYTVNNGQVIPQTQAGPTNPSIWGAYGGPFGGGLFAIFQSLA